MITEISGARGQIVTTWGRDLEGDILVGHPRPISFTVTCRCGQAKQHPGWPLRDALGRAGFVNMGWEDEGHPSEWFCSVECAVGCEPERALARARELGKLSKEVNRQADYLMRCLEAQRAPRP